MATVKKLHMTWVQGYDAMPQKFKDNVAKWREVLPADWEITVWDEETARARWADFAKYSAKCAHHATRSDLIQTRVMRDIGGLYIGTDSSPKNGFPKFLDLLDVVDSHLVVDVCYTSAMNCLAYSDGKNVDFWECALKHQLREGCRKLGDANVHWATGPGCLWEVFKSHRWDMHVSTLKKAYTHHWAQTWPYNPNAYVDPGYAASWHK